MSRLRSVLMVGTGEYTTGYVHDHVSQSDKKLGVVALVYFDMRRRGLIGDLKMVGTTGRKYVSIRRHFQENIQSKYRDMDVSFVSFPDDDVERDPKAYVAALDTMQAGDLVTIFTPDDTHFDIAKEAIQRGLHVLITKPPVQTLEHHRTLVELSEKHNVLVAIEVHKRWDPIYRDAWGRIQSGSLGAFSFFQSYMSQPQFQLETFRSWAGRSSDISYYLNSHHVDFHCWSMLDSAKPVRVTAMGSRGIADQPPHNLPADDTISLLVQWHSIAKRDDGSPKNIGTAIYTASWAAPRSDVHTQQRFHFVGTGGEINVDQAHRGYTLAQDPGAFASLNPLYMKYTPSPDGYFDGQHGYGYQSIEAFTTAASALSNNPTRRASEYNNTLPTIGTTLTATAILHAGRLSLDHAGRAVLIRYADDALQPIALELE